MSTFAKKATSSIAALSIVFSIFAPIAGVSASMTSLEAANNLAGLGIIEDQSANPAAFRLGDSISRREALKVMILASDLELDESCTGQFADLPATDWGCKYAETALAAGLIAANPNFRPDANVSMIESLKMAFQARDIEREDNADWRVGYVNTAVELGLIAAPFTNFDDAAPRGEFFIWVSNSIDATVMDEDDDDLDALLCAILGTCDDEEPVVDPTDPTEPTDPIVVTGDVMVSLNPMSPAAQTVPNSGLVPFGKFDITAGDRDASVSAITLKREGLSNRSDIRRVYFERNGTRVSSRANVTVDNTVLLTFSPALVVQAGQTVSLDLVVELKEGTPAAQTGAEHRFAILSASDIEATGSVQGTYPVRTATMTLGAYTVGTVTATVVNSAASTVNVGDTNVNFGEIRLQTVGDEDNIVKSITFRNDGTGDAEASLSNLGLYSNGQLVSTMVEHNGRDVTFSLNTEIENGRSETFQIRADVSGAERSTENYNFKVRYSTDITVVEKTTGFSAPITLTPANFIVSDVDVNGGDLILTRDTAYTLNRTVPANSTDVVLWAAKLNVTEAITIEDLAVSFTATGGILPNSGNLDGVQSFRLFVGGNNVASYTPTTGEDEFTFESSFTVNASTEMRIEANFRNNIAGSIRLAPIDEDSFTEVRYVSNDELATIDGSANGVNVTIGNSTLLITRNDSLNPTNDIVAGARDVTLFGFAARANDVSDLRITSINPAVAGGIPLANITNVRLFEGSTEISRRNNFDFSNIDVVIPKNSAKSFTIVADFNTNTTGTISLSITDQNQITARDVETNDDLTGTTITGAS